MNDVVKAIGHESKIRRLADLYSAAGRWSRSALWTCFAPALIPFNMLKFPSMYVTDPKCGRSPEDTHDPRITSAGRFLRKISLHELLQLINVLLVRMSLVGPRPEMPDVVSDTRRIKGSDWKCRKV